jgi:hypothetical protein
MEKAGARFMTKHADYVREFYRRQGEARERERILEIIAEVAAIYPKTPLELLEILIKKGKTDATD